MQLTHIAQAAHSILDALDQPTLPVSAPLEQMVRLQVLAEHLTTLMVARTKQRAASWEWRPQQPPARFRTQPQNPRQPHRPVSQLPLQTDVRRSLPRLEERGRARPRVRRRPGSPAPGLEGRARRDSQPRPTSLASALRFLHQRAGSPTPWAIAVTSGNELDQDDIAALLDGTATGDWEDVRRLIQLLDGVPAYFLPLWQAEATAYPRSPSRYSHQHTRQQTTRQRRPAAGHPRRGTPGRLQGRTRPHTPHPALIHPPVPRSSHPRRHPLECPLPPKGPQRHPAAPLTSLSAGLTTDTGYPRGPNT